MTIPLTPEIARAVAWDTGNRRMRKAGRKRWNKSDLAAATAEYLRLLELCKGGAQ